MFAPPLVDVAPLPTAGASALVDVALDPERAGVDRVRALHRLRGVDVAEARGVARRLVQILNEPLHWVASEALVVIDALAPDLGVGLDGGVFVAAADHDELIDDGRFRHDPGLGACAAPLELSDLPGCPSVPWTFRRPAAVVVDIASGSAVTPAIRVLTADGARSVDIGPDGASVWRRAGPRLRLTFRHGDCIVQRLPSPTGDGDDVVTVNAVPLQTSGITVRRLTADSVVDFGTGQVHGTGVEFNDDNHHRLRLRRFIPGRSGQGLAVVNHAMRGIGEAFVVPGRGHVVPLADEEFGVVAVDGDGVHAHRCTLDDLRRRVQVGPLHLTRSAARNSRRGLVVRFDDDD